MRTSTLFNFFLTLLLCLFSIAVSSPAPAKPVDDGAPALIERGIAPVARNINAANTAIIALMWTGYINTSAALTVITALAI
ncbi:hypothetical protein FRC08_000118, partial [Ceratobasidium sp. 394]